MKLINPATSFIILTTSLLFSHPVTANVEKTIFLGPINNDHLSFPAAIADIVLPTLTPDHHNSSSSSSVLRIKLNRALPESPLGEASWFLLDNLHPGQRYEVRVCWSAVEPTNFHLDVFDASQTSPELLLTYLASPQVDDDNRYRLKLRRIGDAATSSRLLLRVLATADYFTDNAELMKNPPPVLVDLILDPFLFNVLPQSLVPTIGHIIIVAVASIFISRFLASYLSSVALQSSPKKPKKDLKE